MNQPSDPGFRRIGLAGINHSEFCMLTGTFSCLINDAQVKKYAGHILELVIRIGRIIGFARTPDKPALICLGDLDRFGLNVFIVHLNNFDSGHRAWIKGLEQCLPH